MQLTRIELFTSEGLLLTSMLCDGACLGPEAMTARVSQGVLQAGKKEVVRHRDSAHNLCELHVTQLRCTFTGEGTDFKIEGKRATLPKAFCGIKRQANRSTATDQDHLGRLGDKSP